MLKLTIARKKWFTVSQDPTGETRLRILHLKPGEVAEIEAKANQVTGKQVNDDFHTEIDFQLYQRTKLFVNSAVVEWEGFEDLKDNPLECDAQGKMKVLKEFGWFGTVVEEFRKELADEIAAEQEEVEKNLTTSVTG